MDNDKIEECAKYLRCCSNIETEAFGLYDRLSQKMNNPESSFVLGIAYDSLKCSKIIQGLLRAFDQPDIEIKNCEKNLSALWTEISEFSKSLSKINNIDNESFCEILKELVNLEDLLIEDYVHFLKSLAPKIIADELSKLVPTDLNNFKKVFENMIDEKQKHREILIEIVYYFEAKAINRGKLATPMVKYKNPDAWIGQSSLHIFSNTSVKNENNES